MSYGHADRIAGTVGGTQASSEQPAPLIDPALFGRDDVRAVLAARDIGTLFGLLKDSGLTQRQIAELTGQSQSEVSEILAGRQVMAYDVLVRIAEGVGVPRELMGLSYGAYACDVTVADPLKGGSAEMLRRHLIALGGIAAVGAPVAGLGELLDVLPHPPPVPLPSRLEGLHVEKVRDLTRQLNDAASASRSDPELSSAAAAWAERLLAVPGSEPVQRALQTAVGELHVEAGWSGFDGGHYERAMVHYARALELATEAGDVYLQALALTYAGLATQEHGQPNDGLKMLQVAGYRAGGIPRDEHRAVVVGETGRAAVQAIIEEESATAYARLGSPQAADTAMGKARQLWTPTPPTPTTIWTVRPRVGRWSGGIWTRRSPSRWRRCAGGRAAVRSAAPNRRSCWPPCTSAPGNPGGWRWPTGRSPLPGGWSRCGLAAASNRWPAHWRPAPVRTRGSSRGRLARSRQRSPSAHPS